MIPKINIPKNNKNKNIKGINQNTLRNIKTSIDSKIKEEKDLIFPIINRIGF